MTQTITINERDYTGLPTSTAIVICLDGSQKEYFEEASKLNLTPNLDKIINTGENLLANSAIPVLLILIIFLLLQEDLVQCMVFVAIFFILHLLEKKS